VKKSQKPGAGKKTSRQIWKVGTQVCIFKNKKQICEDKKTKKQAN
jgi:hypothetical protein